MIQRALMLFSSGLLTNSLIYLFGPLNGIFLTLFVVLISNQITHMLVAIYDKKLSSYKGIQNIISALLTIFIIIVSNIADNLLGAGGILHEFVIGCIIANESISILENAAKCGVPIPKKLINVLEAIRGKGEQDEEIK